MAKDGWKSPKAEPKPLGMRAQADLDNLEAVWAENMAEAWEKAGKSAKSRFIKNLKSL